MAKKTKSTNVDKQVEKKENISYVGNVTLKMQKNNKILKTQKIKNTGTLRLFQGICLALAGISTQSLKNSYLPSYLDVGSNSNTTEPSQTNLEESILGNNKVKITSTYPTVTKDSSGTSVGYEIKFIGVVPYSLIGEKSVKEIGLFADKDGETLLARITIPAGISIFQGTNLIVEWTLGIQNTTTNTQQ